MDFSKFQFTKGKSYQESNVYFFKDGNQELRVSEKIGLFLNGAFSRYVLFEYVDDKKEIKKYVDRKSEEFLQLSNIRNIVDNVGDLVAQCTNCHTIVLKDDITRGDGSSCIYCDMYACRGCKSIKPLAELDENRLCEKCRSKDDEF